MIIIKFTFNLDDLASVLNLVKPYYRVLEIQNSRISNYKTLYYDTPKLDLYNHHHSGKLNRYKLRHRMYVDSSLGFFEVKFKNNKGRTIKTRIKENELPDFSNEQVSKFLKKYLPYDPALLAPKIWVNYSRITLVSKTSPERLTIDLDLEFQKDQNSRILKQLVIAEVKRSSRSDSPFISVMKEKHIRQGSISKYCMAIACMYKKIKINNFKNRINQIFKILNYDIITNCN